MVYDARMIPEKQNFFSSRINTLSKGFAKTPDTATP